MNTHIKQLRKEKKMTQLQLQLQTGIDQALISKFESGDRIPPTETLLLLADFFETSTDYILGRTDIKTPYPKNSDNKNKQPR